jgi:hypothetical protein
MQAMSGTSLALSLPSDIGSADEIRQYADVAISSMLQFAQPAYSASLGLWALSGAVAVLLADRRASLGVWAFAGSFAFAAQIVVGQTFAQPVPPLTLVAVPLAVASVLLAAASVRRIGRVFAVPSSSGSPSRDHVRV